ncbi:Ent-kaurene synthase [Annulohypoxylon maeteangense]|uniref:Ent-kaurene synthase n=1 Tax=Annulohypoxylon maeteangense TaxID=1927788 RepID=UPI0020072B4D|nr:Ent-kaurene synthase [Annulohypoxylon maeteangense]KAI0889799.1 Ent-kaurene synthase [Annulohypoxylon maeteangense]
MDPSLYSQCQSLLASINTQCTTGQAHGFMSSSIYDTAWLSMLRKPGCKTNWLFPECFDFILRSQTPDGAWESYRSDTDGILNTVAALLSLRKHLREVPDNQDWMFRSRQAESALKKLLNDWDITSTDQVGFEVLIIKHLILLEDEGLVFQFPGLNALRALRDSKLERLPISSGVIEFDKLGRWRGNDGSMCGSIASTVAYLMHSSTWDEEAESYLRNALKYGTGEKDGGVPSAWPATIFEASWVVATLAEVGAPINEMFPSSIGDYLEKTLTSNNGTIGFSPSAVPDADDTAKTIIALHHLGKAINVEPLLQAFDSADHFKTYKGERNPSFSANCNILACLMIVEDPTPYGAQIAKAASFLCTQVFSGNVKEKWHSEELYWMMLLSQVFVRLEQRTRDEGEGLRDEIFTRAPHLKQHIPMISLQILIKTLSSQELNGSWGNICEVTAYAILTLSSIAQLPWIQQLQDYEIMASINRGKSFLELHRDQWSKGHYLWIEKVTFASNVLSETYCLAAAITPVMSSFQPPLSHAFLLPTSIISGIRGAMRLISQMPLISGTKPGALKAAELLAAYTFWSLQDQRLDIFPRSGDEKADHKYKIFTPALWAACTTLHGNAITLSALCEMVTFSGSIYLIDEYMEGVIERDFANHLPEIGTLIKRLCSNLRAPGSSQLNGYELEKFLHNGLESGDSSAFQDVKTALTRYIKYFLHNQAVLKSSERLQQILAYELEVFLQAHVDQAVDNQRFALQHGYRASIDSIATLSSSMPLEYANPGRTFYSWIRNTSSNHSSCPFSFIFFNCLISKPGGDVLETARPAYLAEDLCHRLANLCRMYNDYGSTARDQDEGNLNSVNFPEFHNSIRDGRGDGQDIKDQLMWIAEYEREGLRNATVKLEAELHDKGLMDALKVFIDVTDLYGQIYVQRDLTSRIKQPTV